MLFLKGLLPSCAVQKRYVEGNVSPRPLTGITAKKKKKTIRAVSTIRQLSWPRTEGIQAEASTSSRYTLKVFSFVFSPL